MITIILGNIRKNLEILLVLLFIPIALLLINIDKDLGNEKIVASNEYVAPEDYGAVGDGIADDSMAISKAFASGKAVIFKENRKYLIGNNITVTNSIKIDFNNCTLIFAGSIKFKPNEIPLGNVHYKANSNEFINNTSHNEGIFRIISSSMWSDSKKQYKLGFSSSSKNCILDNPFKYNCVGFAFYTPKTEIFIKNIGDIQGYNDYQGSCFEFFGCYVDVENITAFEYGPMTLFSFNYSKVKAVKCNINSSQRPKERNFYYGIVIASCSNWVLDQIYGTSDWHVITTGGQYGVSYNGVIKNSILKYDRHKMYSYVEHENTFNTTLINSSFEGVIINSGSIKNCIIFDIFGITAFQKECYKDSIKIIDTRFKKMTKMFVLRRNIFKSDCFYENISFINCNFDFVGKIYVTDNINFKIKANSLQLLKNGFVNDKSSNLLKKFLENTKTFRIINCDFL